MDITNIMLKTAEPITPDIPISSLAKNTPITTVASSGADDPAAMKVAPATSGDNLSSEKKLFPCCSMNYKSKYMKVH